ncbi:MAG TPA: ABC transporter permease [Thermoanaerobaculia bacterium]|jgi:putative ABC transport system permease protein|nr:ABC transporter permease [Thermoanaerobaculia bacterium]
MRLYRALLHLYPAFYRAEYGDELVRTFAVRSRRAGGGAGRAALWLRELVDLPRSAFLVHGDVLRQDLAFALRALRRSPGFAATAILVAALGIGANTAVFSLTDQVLLRPLPYPSPERLVQLWETEEDGCCNEVSPPNYRDWKERSHSFSALSAWHWRDGNLVGAGAPVRLHGVAVGAELLPLVGVRPIRGRLFSAADERTGAPGTLVIGQGTWQRVFGGDPDVIGRSVRFDDEAFTVIGVLPDGFAFPTREAEFWAPIRMNPDDLADRDNNFFKVVGRLAPGVSLAAAAKEMDAIGAQLAHEYPDTNDRSSVAVQPLHTVNRQSRLLITALVGASGCVLVIACINLATLLLTRALARRRELAVRAVMGAGRERVTRQLLTEALVLTVLGGGLGIAFAAALGPLLAHLVPSELPIVAHGGLDARLIGFALLVTVVTGVAFGVVPALRASGRRLDGLRERGPLGGGRSALRSFLVTAQVAGCVVLLVACGLLLRALLRVQQVDPGFRGAGVLAVQTPLPPQRYQTAAPRDAFYSRVLAEVRTLPGVAAAGYVTWLPLEMGGGIRPVEVPGEVAASPAHRPLASLRFVSPGYLDTMGIPLRAGRGVAAGDNATARKVAVVSEAFVREHFPNGSGLERTFKFAGEDRTIVGVVGEVKMRGLERRNEPQVYLPYNQGMDNDTYYAPHELVLRTSGDPYGQLSAVRAIVRRADPEVPIGKVREVDEVVWNQTASRRTQVWLLGAYAALALLLAGIGIHGLLSLAVSQRQSELGLRLAIGANRREILALALAHGLRVAAIGAGVGLVLAYAAGRSLAGALAGIEPADAVTFGVAVGAAVLMTVSGTLLPALRVLRVDAARVLLSA